jgi:tRNA pseudouridine13 synthase
VGTKPEGVIKSSPADFVVDEVPAYLPSGEGAHLYIHFKKTNLTTDEAVKAIARALNVERRDIGVAGLKDKIAVTTQWISVPVPVNDRRIDDVVSAGLEGLAGIEVLEHKRHNNKLKTGHLKGNRFTIIVRDIDPARLSEAQAAIERIAKEGVPNAFGAQRFGRDGDNYERAMAWLTGRERAPGDPRLRRFHFSAMQSHVFNRILEERVQTGSWNVPMHGDLLRKLSPEGEEGGMFVCTDVQLDRERAARGELCPTGPIVGDKMRQPEHEAFELEQRITVPLIEGIDLRRARSLGEGTRRSLLLRATEVFQNVISSSLDEAIPSDQRRISAQPCAILLRFVLPKGAYATTVLDNVFATRELNVNQQVAGIPDAATPQGDLESGEKEE